jgi:two-component system KDP operon response regulator KdpE
MSRLGIILVVDDEPLIRRTIRTSLSAQGYEVREAGTGQAALAAIAATAKPDVMILDLGLPDRDGMSIIEEVRKTSTMPIIVLSIRDDEAGKVKALDLGADDYVTKPFGMVELTARVRTALRHRLQVQGVEALIRSGDLAIDLVHRRITIIDNEVKLTPKEYDLLAYLARQSGKVLRHRQILRDVWGPAQEEDIQYLRVYIRSLRQKIEADATQPRYVLTEPGVGYRLWDGG